MLCKSIVLAGRELRLKSPFGHLLGVEERDDV